MQVWGLLNNNDFVNDPVKLKSIFDKNGVEEASDLKLLDEVTLKSYYYLFIFWFNYLSLSLSLLLQPVIISIAELLKPIPKKKFLLALGKYS